MGIFTRFVTIFKADIHGVMDQLEDKRLLLKQHLREMEDALLHERSNLEKSVGAREKIIKEKASYEKEEETLDREITRSIEKEKDDVARLLIRKLKSMNGLRGNFERNIDLFNSEILAFQQNIEKRQLEYDHLKLKADEYFHMTDLKKMEDDFSKGLTAHFFSEISEAEIDLELTIRKDTLKGRV
ncbi:MAG: PspA/IM30 family protein [Proteobacteria bacterium]|nr:PspA/IM30 family protein [Pseudomonadota bacterium]